MLAQNTVYMRFHDTFECDNLIESKSSVALMSDYSQINMVLQTKVRRIRGRDNNFVLEHPTFSDVGAIQLS